MFMTHIWSYMSHKLLCDSYMSIKKPHALRQYSKAEGKPGLPTGFRCQAAALLGYLLFLRH